MAQASTRLAPTDMYRNPAAKNLQTLRREIMWDPTATIGQANDPGSREQIQPPTASEEEDLQFRAYQGSQGLEFLAPQWTALAESIPGAAFNHFPGWYRAHLLSQRCDPNSLWFIAAYRAQRLVAVFPLQFQSHRVKILRPRFLGTVDDDELQLSDFVFAQTASNANLLYLMTQWLRSQRQLRWDVLRLVKISENSSFAYAARARLPKATVATRYDGSAYFDTSGSYDQATQAMSNKFRSNLRRRARLAENSAPLRFQSCRRQDELDQGFKLFLEIEASGWKGGAGTSSAIQCNPGALAFYTALRHEFGAREEFVINLLWHGEQAIAAQLGLRIGTTLHILKVGYNDANALFAPGILLQERTIREACEDPGIDLLSMVNDPYWAKSFKPLTVGVWLYLVPNWTLQGLLAHLGILATRKWRGQSEEAKSEEHDETQRTPEAP
jgi:CelD/BcsL family acetyltransferase involved in cellulose biosynthesis